MSHLYPTAINQTKRFSPSTKAQHAISLMFQRNSLARPLEQTLPSPRHTQGRKLLRSFTAHFIINVDQCPIRGEYKVWIYKCYVVPPLLFNLTVNAITTTAIKKLQTKVTSTFWSSARKLSMMTVTLYVPFPVTVTAHSTQQVDKNIPRNQLPAAMFSSHSMTINDYYPYYIIIIPAFKRGTRILMYTLAVINTIKHKGFNWHNYKCV